MKSSIEIADAMLKAREAMIAECYGQREEILKAFVAKHGFEPDEAMQIHDKLRWFVVRLDDEFREKVHRGIIEDRVNTELSKLTWWQRFCIWMARL